MIRAPWIDMRRRRDLGVLVATVLIVAIAALWGLCTFSVFGEDIPSATSVLDPKVNVQSNHPDEETHPMILIRTTLGDIKIELYQDKAPITVSNFLEYVDSGFYNGTIFHRVIDGFMIQGGGFTRDMEQKPTRAPIRNEADNGLKNDRGTIAMARTPHIHSATCQFFINVVDNDFLNHNAPTPQGYGYCVFGRVVEGMDVVDKIKSAPTTTVGPFQNVPVDPIEILSVERINN